MKPRNRKIAFAVAASAALFGSGVLAGSRGEASAPALQTKWQIPARFPVASTVVTPTNQPDPIIPLPPSTYTGTPPRPGPDPNEKEISDVKGRLQVEVIDGRTMQPIDGAEVVIAETEQRMKTGKNGLTPWVDVPVIRDNRFRPIIAQLHGQLTAIAYKNGYRDSIHFGIRMHEGRGTRTTIWMYQLGPADRRIEPTAYREPYHHLFIVQLADRFRESSQLGEGFQHP
jgi:hypothetical protein